MLEHRRLLLEILIPGTPILEPPDTPVAWKHACA